MEATECQDVHGWTTLQKTALVVVLLGIFAVQIPLQRTGHDWGGDFAQYLNHGRNLATGHPYADTGYIYNPDNTVIGPRAYPPLFPAFMAIVYSLFGLNLSAFQYAMLGLNVATIAVSCVLFARRLSAWSVIAIAILLGYGPITWEWYHVLDSEHLYNLWWMLTMLVYFHYRGDPEKPSEHLGPAILIGLLVYVAIGTRTVGIVLPPALFLTEAIVYRRLTRFTVVSLGTAIVCYAIQKVMLGSGGSGYLDQLSLINAQSIATNLYEDALAFIYFWRNGRWKMIAGLSGIPFLFLALYGYVKEGLPRPQLMTVATALYMVLIIIWPGAYSVRMVLPILPAFLYWIFYAGESLIPEGGMRKITIAAMVLYTLACFVGEYKSNDWGPIPGPYSETSKELFAEVATHVDRDEVCLFFKPRVLALYAGRSCISYPIDVNPTTTERTIDFADVTVAITRTEELEEVKPILQNLGFTIQWQNADFQLWRRGAE